MKKRIITLTILILMVFGFSLIILQANGGAAEIQRSVFSAGGRTVSGGNMSLSATLGQPVVWASGEGSVSILAGFWPGLVGVVQLLLYFPLMLN
jgi:hypothetical protein